MRPICKVFLLLMLSDKVFAENGCPNGYQPMGWEVRGLGDCAPIPGYYDQDEAKDQKPSSSFESSLPIFWGAIAVDTNKQVAGFSSDEKSVERAHKTAIKDCKAKGGGHCGIAMAYSSILDQCVGLAVGEKGKFGAARGGTEGQALYFAMETCKAQGVKCEVYYANCLFDKRVE